MALETATYLNQLVSSNPPSSDPKSQGDDHLRLLKSVLQNTFPNVTGAVTPTQVEFNFIGGATSSIQTQLTARSLLAGNVYPAMSVHDYSAATLRAATPIVAADVATMGYVSGLSLGTTFAAGSGDVGKYAYCSAPGVVIFQNFAIAANTALTTPVITGEKLLSVAMPANNIDLATGNYFTKTITGATTLTVSNAPVTGQLGWFALELTNPSTNVTFFSGIKRPGGTTPTLTTTGIDVLLYVTRDGGTTWKENVVGKNYT